VILERFLHQSHAGRRRTAKSKDDTREKRRNALTAKPIRVTRRRRCTMRFNPADAWLGTLITLDVTAWFVWLAAFAVARHALDPMDAGATPTTDLSNRQA